MSTATFFPDFINIPYFPHIGFGKDFLRLKKYYDKEVNDLRKSETLGQLDGALQTLEGVFMECSEKGWDGYDARPISEAAYIEAGRLIESLPITPLIPTPEIVPEPSGEIGLEWSKGRRQVFIASVNGQNEIVYAGLYGTNKIHGTEYFGDTLPSIIFENLKRLYF